MNMSAFIVKDETINRVVTWLVTAIRDEVYSRHLKERLIQLNYYPEDIAFPEKLATDMFALNVSAVKQRYQNIRSVPNFTFTRTYSASLVLILKSLECWLYQCTEGDVPKQGLFIFFQDLVEVFLLRKIVHSLPEYEEAEWD